MFHRAYKQADLVIYLSFIYSFVLPQSHPLSKVSYTCLGGELHLTCISNKTSLRWYVFVYNNTDIMRTASVSIYDTFSQSQSIKFESRVLNISRGPVIDNSSQLTSILTSEDVTVDLNETVIGCEEHNTTVHVIGVNSKSII